MKRMSASLKFLPALVLLTVTGCVMVGPDYETPPADIAEQWLSASEQVRAEGSAEHATWWENFNDPALNELVTRARAQNLGLQIAACIYC